MLTKLIENLHRRIDLWSVSHRAAMVLAISAVIIFFDFATPTYVVSTGFYLVPILLAAWYCGAALTLAVTCVCAISAVYISTTNLSATTSSWELLLSALSLILVFALFATVMLYLKNAFRKLHRQSTTDWLTRLSNRRDFYAQAAREVERSRRYNAPLALMMLDIDHFKQINDQYGHAAGDKVLRDLGEVCRATLRNIDIAARMGGEEFAVLMPGTPMEMAVDAAQRLLQKLSGIVVDLPDQQFVSFTVSIGVSILKSSDMAIDDVLSRADFALYEAKQGGRNQVRQATG